MIWGSIGLYWTSMGNDNEWVPAMCWVTVQNREPSAQNVKLLFCNGLLIKLRAPTISMWRHSNVHTRHFSLKDENVVCFLALLFVCLFVLFCLFVSFYHKHFRNIRFSSHLWHKSFFSFFCFFHFFFFFFFFYRKYVYYCAFLHMCFWLIKTTVMRKLEIFHFL